MAYLFYSDLTDCVCKKHKGVIDLTTAVNCRVTELLKHVDAQVSGLSGNPNPTQIQQCSAIINPMIYIYARRDPKTSNTGQINLLLYCDLKVNDCVRAKSYDMCADRRTSDAGRCALQRGG